MKKRVLIQYKSGLAAIAITGLITLPLFSQGETAPQNSQNQNRGFAAAVTDLLDPDRWFDILKKNITIPLPKNSKEIELPKPEEALKEVSPKLQEINVEVREETGVDLAKFIGWSAKVLKAISQIVINLLEEVSRAMGE